MESTSTHTHSNGYRIHVNRWIIKTSNINCSLYLSSFHNKRNIKNDILLKSRPGEQRWWWRNKYPTRCAAHRHRLLEELNWDLFRSVTSLFHHTDISLFGFFFFFFFFLHSSVWGTPANTNYFQLPTAQSSSLYIVSIGLHTAAAAHERRNFLLYKRIRNDAKGCVCLNFISLH